MNRASRRVREAPDDPGPEYTFDYVDARPNAYGERLRGRAVAVMLGPHVAFPDSKAADERLPELRSGTGRCRAAGCVQEDAGREPEGVPRHGGGGVRQGAPWPT